MALIRFSNNIINFPRNIYEDAKEQEEEEEKEGPKIEANYVPVLNQGITHLYIYSSICKPMNVGGVKVPLLKSIWLDGERRNYSHGEIINVPITNPMYIPVSQTSINSIEVNIRNDYGKYIPFPDGSVTSLTLHFKKTSTS